MHSSDDECNGQSVKGFTDWPFLNIKIMATECGTNQGGGDARTKSLPKLPDNAICATQLAGLGKMCFCLVSNSHTCKYHEPGVLGNYCFHPYRLIFADNVGFPKEMHVS